MEEIVNQYHEISSQFAINPPLLKQPQVKAMMFSPLSSMVGVAGSMAISKVISTTLISNQIESNKQW